MTGDPGLGASGVDAAPTPGSDEGPASGQPGRPTFAHASEAEMARILDFYGVPWTYEPDVFPILWNLDGDVVESFAPDFYLPDFDLYLEMTTLRQKLVRKKNRKLRRLRELYPGIRIKLFYARDFRELMLKYGKLALHGALSGSSGQVGGPIAPTPVAPMPTAPTPVAPGAKRAAPTAKSTAPAVPARLLAAPGSAAPVPAPEAVGSRRGRRARAAAAAEPEARR